jgi:putative ABC transport system permease protein
MYPTVLSALMSHWRRKPLQLGILLLGLALATALWSAVQAINTEARSSYERAAAVLGQSDLKALVKRDGNRIPQDVYIRLRRNGWLVSPVLEGEVRYGNVRFRMIGFDPLTIPPQGKQPGVDLAGADLVSFLTPPGLFFVSLETSKKLAGIDTPPVRIADSVPPGTIMTDIGNAQVILGAEGVVSRFLLWQDQPRDRLPLEQISGDLVEQPKGTENDLASLTDSFHLNLTAFGFLSFAVGFFIVHSAIGLAFEQRRSMLRTFRALGVPVTVLVVTLVLELVVLALIAGFTGVILGYVVAAALLPDVAASLRGLYGTDIPGTLAVRPSVWIAGIAIATTGTLASSAGALWRVSRMSPLAPAQPLAWLQSSERTISTQLLAGIALMPAAALLAFFGSGLASGFLLLGAMLLGAALLLPALLSLTLKAGSELARGPLGQWFWADTRQQLPGLSLALMALMLALAANVGVSTMVESFRLTFTGWLDQRLASELYVTARNDEEAAAVRNWLTPRSDAVLPIWNVEGHVEGQPVLIYGIADNAIYREKWPLLDRKPSVWSDLFAERALLVNEQLFRRAKLRIGDHVSLPGGVALPIGGVFSDYGNPKGQIILSNDLLVRLYPNVGKLRYAVRTEPANAEALATALQKQFDLPPQNVIDQASLKSLSLQIFDRTFAVTAALNILTLGVAGLAMLTSFLTLSEIRLPQLAPVWAVGLSRKHLAWLELIRSLSLALLTMFFALPVGLMLAWVLLTIVNVEAFGWQLPLYLFPYDWMRLAALSFLAAALAAWLPVRRLMNIEPSQLLKVFAHER